MEVSLDDLNELNHALDNCRYWLQHLSRNQKPDSDYFYNMDKKYSDLTGFGQFNKACTLANNLRNNAENITNKKTKQHKKTKYGPST